jgi:hypothetical protein
MFFASKARDFLLGQLDCFGGVNVWLTLAMVQPTDLQKNWKSNL